LHRRDGEGCLSRQHLPLFHGRNFVVELHKLFVRILLGRRIIVMHYLQHSRKVLERLFLRDVHGKLLLHRERKQDVVRVRIPLRQRSYLVFRMYLLRERGNVLDWLHLFYMYRGILLHRQREQDDVRCRDLPHGNRRDIIELLHYMRGGILLYRRNE
jgi:hypothetical protein